MKLLIALALTAPAAPEAADELADWVAQAQSHLGDSAAAQAITQSREAARYSEVAARAQSPWTMRSTLAHGQQFPRNGSSFVPRLGMSVPTSRSWEAVLSGTVEYRSRDRWAVQLEGAAGYFDNSEVAGAQVNDVPFNVDLSVTYDVISGGSDSAENQAARAESISAVAQRLAARDRMMQAELLLMGQVVELYGNRCKLAEVERIEAATAKALKQARLQVETKVISPADALNYEFLADSVRSSLAGLRAQSRSIMQQVSAWGPVTAATFAKLVQRRPSCREPLARVLSRAVKARRTPQAIEEIAVALPASGARQAAATAASISAGALLTAQRPSLAPFLLGRVSRAIGLDEEVALVEAGLQFEWNVAGERGDAQLRAAQARRSAAARAVEQQQLEARAGLRQLLAEIEAEQALLQALDGGVQHSEKLGKILEVQRAIGEVSSLNQAIAIANQVEAHIAYIDSWLRLRRAILHLGVLEATAEATRPELAKTTESAWTD